MVELFSSARGTSQPLISPLTLAVGVLVFVLGGLVSTAGAQTRGGDDQPSIPSADPGGDGDESAEESKTVREQVMYLLSGYHFAPSRKDLDEVAEPSRIVDELRAIAGDESMRPSMRGRAVDTLALYEIDKAVAFVDQLIEPVDEELADKHKRVASMLRHRAILTFAEMRDGETTVERLESLLDAEDRQIRLTVVAALGQHAGEAGKRRLEEYAPQVTDEIVRDKLTSYVATDRIPQTED